jgi:Spy/CpxP family protein refolding chaperone
MRTKITFTLSALLTLGATNLNAQTAPEAVMSPQELQAAKELVETRRNLAVIDNLPLTKVEADKFWPLYEEYRQRVRVLGERRLAVIEAYAERYRAGNVDDEFAEQGIRESLKIKLDVAKLQQKYWTKFRRILPAMKSARFYQLESKMDAEIDYILAGGIPLVDAG